MEALPFKLTERVRIGIEPFQDRKICATESA
jgi:hypothetical protein